MNRTQVDFCHLATEGQFHSFLFRSCLKLIDRGLRTQLRTSDESQAAELSERLWTFPGGFISHEIVQGKAQEEGIGTIAAQLLIASGSGFPCQALVNLTLDFPADFSEFKHIVEIVPSDPDRANPARERFKRYRDEGAEPKYHKIPPPA